MKTIKQLIDRGSALKAQIDALTDELRAVNKALSESVPPAPGTKTSRAMGTGVEAIIQRKENIKWDQEKLKKAQSHFGFFFDCFSVDYKAKTKAVEAHMARNPDFRKAIEWSRTITAGAPSVKYEPINDEGEPK